VALGGGAAYAESAAEPTAAPDAGPAEGAAKESTANVLYGQVTAVDGRQITLALAEMPQSDRQQDGKLPSGQPGDRQPDEKPQGGQRPDGQSRGQGGRWPGGGQLTPTGETRTITATDQTTIAIAGVGQGAREQPGAASLSDIAVGSVITVTLVDGAEDQAAAIVIMSIAPSGRREGAQGPDAAGQAGAAA